MLYFFIDERVYRSNDTLPACPRILRYDPATFPFSPKSFKTIKKLRANDLNYLRYRRKNPRFAKLILLPHHIIEVKPNAEVFTHDSGDVDSMNYYLLKHGITGDWNDENNTFTGVHHLTFPLPDNIRDFKVIKPENSQGVYVAKFSILKADGLTYKKKSISTMFPKNWSNQRYYEETFYALQNKRSIEGSATKFISETLSGIPVKIYFKENGKLATVFPNTSNRILLC